VSDFHETNFLDQFSKSSQVSDLLNIFAVGAELLYVHGRTDMTKLMVAFRNFANALKNGMVLTDTDVSCMFVLQHTVMEEPVTLRLGGGGLFGPMSM